MSRDEKLQIRNLLIAVILVSIGALIAYGAMLLADKIFFAGRIFH